MAAPSLDDLPASFELYLRATNKSRRTIETYREALDGFTAHFQATSRRPLDQARREDIEAWMTVLLARWKPPPRTTAIAACTPSTAGWRRKRTSQARWPGCARRRCQNSRFQSSATSSCAPSAQTPGRHAALCCLAFSSPLTLTRLWANTPRPHQIWAPSMPAIRVRAQPKRCLSWLMRPWQPVRHFTSRRNPRPARPPGGRDRRGLADRAGVGIVQARPAGWPRRACHRPGERGPGPAAGGSAGSWSGARRPMPCGGRRRRLPVAAPGGRLPRPGGRRQAGLRPRRRPVWSPRTRPAWRHRCATASPARPRGPGAAPRADGPASWSGVRPRQPAPAWWW
jgi:hypothetical protein